MSRADEPSFDDAPTKEELEKVTSRQIAGAIAHDEAVRELKDLAQKAADGFSALAQLLLKLGLTALAKQAGK